MPTRGPWSTGWRRPLVRPQPGSCAVLTVERSHQLGDQQQGKPVPNQNLVDPFGAAPPTPQPAVLSPFDQQEEEVTRLRTRIERRQIILDAGVEMIHTPDGVIAQPLDGDRISGLAAAQKVDLELLKKVEPAAAPEPRAQPPIPIPDFREKPRNPEGRRELQAELVALQAEGRVKRGQAEHLLKSLSLFEESVAKDAWRRFGILAHDIVQGHNTLLEHGGTGAVDREELEVATSSIEELLTVLPQWGGQSVAKTKKLLTDQLKKQKAVEEAEASIIEGEAEEVDVTPEPARQPGLNEPDPNELEMESPFL